MSGKVSWGIIGTGAIASAFARALGQCQTGQLVAVGSRGQASADKFGEQWKVARRHASYEALLADKEVRAVYISTPHPMHAEWSIKAVEAGKAVLCEKPSGLNYAETMAMVEAARRRGGFWMEAFMYRCHPQTAKLVALIREGGIGEVRMIQATFGFHAGFNADSRIFNNDLAGGGIMDVGCYPVSMSRLIAGAATGKPFADPSDVKAAGHLGQTGVDEWAAATLLFPGDIVAQVATGVALTLENNVRIFGSKGQIVVPNPWTADRSNGGSFQIQVFRGGQAETIQIDTTVTAFAYEADMVGRCLASGRQQAEPPAMTWDDSLGNIAALDRWRAGVGLTYEQEKPARVLHTVHRRPLTRRPDAPIPVGTIAGLGKPVSRLVLGVDNQPNMPYGAVMWDDFFELGGNCFDTAWVYGGGHQERLLGQWVRNRGLRERVVVISKSAHTPWCDPANLTKHFQESLDRLQMDYADIYIMHRDNPQIPVGEFVDVLNEHVRAGRIRIFGGSNWSLARVEEANQYARQKGLMGFSVVSNNFSLARMVDPVWGGCVASSDPESRAWLTRTQLPLLPWSSQARGFFTGRGDPADKSDAEMVRCWHSEDNFQRRARAYELAAKKGVEPINIALAYVLAQPFPTFPLIGPRTLSETASSIRGLTVSLTPQEVRWLNLES